MAYSSSLIRSAADAVGEFRRTSDRAAREHFPLKLLADRTAGHRRERMVRRSPDALPVAPAPRKGASRDDARGSDVRSGGRGARYSAGGACRSARRLGNDTTEMEFPRFEVKPINFASLSDGLMPGPCDDRACRSPTMRLSRTGVCSCDGCAYRPDLRGERNIAVSPPVRTYGSYGCPDCYAVLAIRPGTESMPYQRWMGAVYRTVGSGNNVGHRIVLSPGNTTE